MSCAGRFKVGGMIDGGVYTDASRSEDEAQLTRLVLLGLQRDLDPLERAQLDRLAQSVPNGDAIVDDITQAWSLAAVARQPSSIRHVGLPITRRGLIAAGMAGLAAAGFATWRLQGRDYTAPRDAPLHVNLADGTKVVLSPGGRIRVQMDTFRRYATILQGESFWDVAHEAQRPFELAVDAFRLRVLGTRFNVQPMPAGLRVDLLEGALRVSGGDAQPVILAPGQRYWAHHEPLVAMADVSGQAAWVDGRLIFDDASLGDVAARVQMQTGRRIEFAEPSLSQLRFSGLLAVGDEPGWRLGLEAVLPVKVQTTADGLKLYPRSQIS